MRPLRPHPASEASLPCHLALHLTTLSAGALSSLAKFTWLPRVPEITLEALETQTEAIFLLGLQETEELRS